MTRLLWPTLVLALGACGSPSTTKAERYAVLAKTRTAEVVRMEAEIADLKSRLEECSAREANSSLIEQVDWRLTIASDQVATMRGHIEAGFADIENATSGDFGDEYTVVLWRLSDLEGWVQFVEHQSQ